MSNEFRVERKNLKVIKGRNRFVKKAAAAKVFAPGPVDRPTVRLNKFLADCGITSRRKADGMILSGLVKVNGHKVFELGVRVNPKEDNVVVDGSPVNTATEKIYMMFYKPRNVVTTMLDPEGRPCIADYVQGLDARVFPVGRLDWETEGLLILTNDGDFSNQIMHPSTEVTKTYLVKVNGHLTEEDVAKLQRGVSIIGGRVSAKSVQKVRRGADQYGWYRVVITEGKNRQIHRMFEKLGYDVIKLQRVAIGQLELGSLERGEMRPLSPAQVKRVFTPEEDPTPARLKFGMEENVRRGPRVTPSEDGPSMERARPGRTARQHVRRNGRSRF